MDLRVPKFLHSCIEKVSRYHLDQINNFDRKYITNLYELQVPPGEGYDHNFCVTPNWHGGSGYVAQAVHPSSGR